MTDIPEEDRAILELIVDLGMDCMCDPHTGCACHRIIKHAFLAERSRQIERDAKIADGMDGWPADEYDQGYCSAARDVAAAIRAQQEPK